MRAAEADARWLSIMRNPSMRNGAWSSTTYVLKATIVPTVTCPSMACQPPYSSTPAMPSLGRFSITGAQCARASIWRTDAHRSRSAALASRATWRGSAAKDFTTRAPVTFSSTMVATSAWRAWTIHETGNSRLRILRPAT